MPPSCRRAGADIAANGGYRASGLPSGLTIDGNTGAISGTPDAARTSTSSVTVTVADAAGNEAQAYRSRFRWWPRATRT